MRILILFLFIAIASCKGQDQTKQGLDKNKSDHLTSLNETIGVSTVELKEILNSGEDIILVDVRTPEEISQGKIGGALEVDFKAESFEEDILKLDREKPIYLYCRSGRRSLITSDYLLRNGYKDIYNVVGGYKAWIAESE